MTMADDERRQRAIHARARGIERELVEKLERGDDDDLDGGERLLFVARGVGLRAMRRPGQSVALTPVEVAVLAEGAGPAVGVG